MDRENTTTRKGFFKKAGLALVGVFALTSVSRGESKRSTAAASPSTVAPRSALSRIRPAQGTVERKANV